MELLKIGNQIIIENYPKGHPGIIEAVTEKHILVSYPNGIGIKKYSRTNKISAITEGKRVHLGVIKSEKELLEYLLETYHFEEADELFKQNQGLIDLKTFQRLKERCLDKQHSERITHVNSKLKNLLKEYRFEDADNIFEQNNDVLDLDNYQNLRKDYLDKQLSEKKSSVNSNLKNLLEGYHFEDADKLFEENKDILDLDAYHDLRNDYLDKQLNERIAFVNSKLKSLIDLYHFDDADELFKENKDILDSDAYRNLRKACWDKRCKETYEELTDIFKRYSFNEADIFYKENDCFINQYKYEGMKNKYLEELADLQQKEKAKDVLLNVINNDYVNSKNHWMLKASRHITEDDFNDLLVYYVQRWFKQHSHKVPDNEQALAIAQIWDDIQVVARAGSGKTATVINRAAFLIENCNINPSDILILAFNKNAATEVSQRLTGLLKNDIPQSMTFHALAWAIVHPKEDILKDDDESGWQKSRGIQLLIDEFIKNNESIIKELMIQYFRKDWDKIISGGYNLSPDEMVKHRRSLPYLGFDGIYYKSHAEKKIADYLFEHEAPYKYECNFWWSGRNYKPDFFVSIANPNIKGVVVEYFGIKGDPDYDEQRVDKRMFWKSKPEYIFIEMDSSWIDNDLLDRYIGKCLKNCGLSMRRITDEEIWYQIKDRELDHFSRLVSQFICRCRNALITPEDLTLMVKEGKTNLLDMTLCFLRVIWKIYSNYLENLKVNEQEDFQGLLLKASELIAKGNSIWDRKQGTGDLSKLKYIFVDEYQDFSPLFYKLLSAIKEINPEIKVFCVGDDWQAINGFAGSDLKYFNNFCDFFPNGKVLSITTNYRSSHNIVALGNHIMDGCGVPAKATNSRNGEIWLANINEFEPTHDEEHSYEGSVVIPALIRLVHSLIKDNKNVAILCRRKNGWPWYNPYGHNFREGLLTTIREAFPENLRSKIKTVDSVHSYKGKQEDSIIIADAIERSYPLIHPDNVFYNVLGQTLDNILSDEKRLFYVGVSRPKTNLYFITDGQTTTPFLKQNQVNYLDWKKTEIPSKQGSKYLISIKGNTFQISETLKSHKYTWSPSNRMWGKHVSADNFSENKLFGEQWVKKSSGILITVTDEFGKKIVCRNI